MPWTVRADAPPGPGQHPRQGDRRVSAERGVRFGLLLPGRVMSIAARDRETGRLMLKHWNRWHRYSVYRPGMIAWPRALGLVIFKD
jgi:hypothetical protein